MRDSFKLLPACWWLISFSASLNAQTEGPKSAEVPNAMGAHTWFIILALGALLLWGISYSLQLQKEAMSRKKGREDLVSTRDHLLDEISDLEARKESGQIAESRYKKDLNELKVRLSRVVQQLGAR